MASQDYHPIRWHFSQINLNSFQFQGQGLLLLLAFFCLIILITLLSLYAHWVCRHRRVSTNATPIIGSQPHATAEIAARSLGLDAATIDSFPIFLHSSLVASNSTDETVLEVTECCICLCLFEGEEKVMVLPQCLHTYHSECIDKWLTTQPSCPLCRASLLVI